MMKAKMKKAFLMIFSLLILEKNQAADAGYGQAIEAKILFAAMSGRRKDCSGKRGAFGGLKATAAERMAPKREL
jgi:hypothetical protein